MNSDDGMVIEEQKRVVNMMAERFVVDYLAIKETHEEIEHFYEMWIKQFPPNKTIEGIVWKVALSILTDISGKDRS